jgi:hypothetical protein
MKILTDRKVGKLTWSKPSFQTIDFHQTEAKLNPAATEMGFMTGS